MLRKLQKKSTPLVIFHVRPSCHNSQLYFRFPPTEGARNNSLESTVSATVKPLSKKYSITGNSQSYRHCIQYKTKGNRQIRRVGHNRSKPPRLTTRLGFWGFCHIVPLHTPPGTPPPKRNHKQEDYHNGYSDISVLYVFIGSLYPYFY